MIKLIVSDIDGTLVRDGENKINQELFDVIMRLKREKQIHFAAASGRQAASIEYTFAPIGKEIFYIAENGAVIQPDVRWENAARFISEKKHDDIRQFIARVRQEMHLKFTTFDDVDERVVAEWTGLSRPRAALARKHEASVTLIWRDSDEQMKRFAAELARQGLKIVPGARFWHILDTSCGKDVAVHWLVEQYHLHDGFDHAGPGRRPQ